MMVSTDDAPSVLNGQVLGPVQLCVGGRPLPVTALQQRAVLAMLLLNAGRPVGVDVLTDRLWGAHPPKTARGILHCYVSRLRRHLTASGLDGETALATQPPGYLLRLDRVALDLHRFDDMVGAARVAQADGQLLEAAALLRAGLDEWSGPAAADVRSGRSRWAEVRELDERRLAITEQWIDLELHLGRHTELVARLRALAEAHPTRERMRCQLMLALVRAGRQVEALEVYHETRHRYATELGIECGAELQSMHRAVLAGDTGLARPRAGDPYRRGEDRLAVATLPAAAPLFVDRADEVALLTGGLQAACDQRTINAVMAITGPPGVGKTSLAIRVANLMSGSFADGQLYVDLAGPDGRPVGPTEATGRLLHLLGVPPMEMPATLAERAQLYQDMILGRQVLVVLDDAVGEVQVRPLLPATPGCGVVISGRFRLNGLLGATHLALAPLPRAAGLELLRVLVGKDQVEREPAAADQILACCAGLPLAIEIAAARLVARPGWSLRTLADRLVEPEFVLTEFRVGDVDLAQRIGRTYALCPLEQQRAFRMLARLGDQTVPVDEAAHLLGCPADTAEELLDALANVSLLDRDPYPVAGRPQYRVLEPLRRYAIDRSRSEDPADGAEAA